MSPRTLLFAIVAASAVACGPGAPSLASHAPIGRIRGDGLSSSDGEVVGRWALAEMFEPGGDAANAAKARARLDAKGVSKGGLYGSLAVAVFDEAHGDPKRSADAYLSALAAARSSDDPDAPLVAWFSSHHVLGLRGSVSELYANHKSAVESLIRAPGHLGWRSAAELVEWSVAEAFDKAETTGDAYDADVTKRLGCAKAVRLAGPFGRGTVPDRRRSFEAERPGPWPPSWPADPSRGSVPHILKVEQHRCFAASTEHVDEGVFYAESFFASKAPLDLIVAVQGSVKVWVDDAPVLERDLRQWGAWQKFGVAVHVDAGRHRVLARTMSDGTSVRLLRLDGTPADVDTDGDARSPYALDAPTVLADPNVIDGIVRARARFDANGAADAPLRATLAAYVAHIEGMNDVASVLIAPLVESDDAGAIALEEAAAYVKTDPALSEDVRARDERKLRTRALLRDPRLWRSRAWIIVEEAEQKGLVDGVEPLRKLADEFPGEPEVLEALARLYGRLTWRAERMTALADLAKRFPDDVNALRLYLGVLEEDGPIAEADKIAVRVKKLDPDSEVDLDRAIARRDYRAAIKELERLGKRRPDRKEIAGRIADVLERAGDPSAAATQLTKALAKNPEDTTARFRLADRAYAKGDTTALRKALADALSAGAKGEELRGAIDLLEGATDLEPYRMDGRATIREFEAWEKAKHHMDGNAARVLDYAAVWVHPDGSSEMLEHEILRIQSQEAIGQESEQQPPTGLILRLRVIKPDGSILEPEPVAGKPTLTMPHLEVGDYIEIEHVSPTAGDGQKGKRFHGPQWFFREADKGYWRSEFVTITPKDRPLDIETRGAVPAPKMKDVGATFVERRWRVDQSPPAPEEPDSPRPTEFLPSVRIGWGITLADALDRLVDLVSDETPLDPRLHERALEIVKGVPEGQRDERARKVYNDVLAHIEEGQETDGRRVLTGKSGSRQAAFLHLMRQLGIPVEVALVKDRLAMPPLGPMSEVENYDSLVLRVDTGRADAKGVDTKRATAKGADTGIRWMTVRDKFAPYAYVPAQLRGQTAVRLIAGLPRDTTSSGGSIDGILLEGRANLKEDGSASVELVQSFAGKIGIVVRNAVDKVPGAQLSDYVESRLLGHTFAGARLRDLKIEHKDDLSLPLTLRMTADVPQFARVDGTKLTIKALFPLHLAQLGALPTRQTPLMLDASHVEVRFEVVLPESIRMPASLPAHDAKDGERFVLVKDAVHGHALTLDRAVDIPAGRVQPGEEYARFQRFVQEADAIVEREIVLGR